jgi:hypothetical protein
MFMTQVDVVFRYGVPPTESATLAIARMREIYGVRKVEFREAEKLVRVEFDSTRLTESIIHQFLRRAGLDVTEKIQLFKSPVLVDPAPAAKPSR